MKRKIILIAGACTVLIILVILFRYPQTVKNPNVIVNKIEEVKQKQQDSKPTVSQDKVLLEVPFTSQAPLARWDDPRQQDGCEEASMLMAIKWAREEKFGSAAEKEKEILAISEFEQLKYGNYHDTSVEDTIRWVKDYFNFDKLLVKYEIDTEDIKRELTDGNLVAVPADGRKLNNPNFTGAGPDRHMLVVRGYDEASGEFITNDPGTRKGEGYRYKYDILLRSILNYPTGHHEPITDPRTVMIVIKK